MSMNKNITIYTDGACSGNPGPGGWAAIIQQDDKQDCQEISGGEIETTNNRMELTAALKALASLSSPSRIELYTDSKYLQDGITQWIEKWKINNWQTSNKTAVKNQDLWQKIDELRQKHTVEWNWVKAHNGDELNERVDALARSAIIATIMANPEKKTKI